MVPRSKAKPTAKPPSTSEDFPVVGVGASAGGLEAFGKLIGNIPPQTGMAFVLVQHLDPTHASNMVGLLKRFTSIPVHEVTDNIKLEPDNVYMIPPNSSMTITDHTLKLAAQTEHAGIIHSIDMFFQSMAADLKEKAICIILSGTGTDGTMGARAIKEQEGMVMVQAPDTAGYDGMPQAAISAGLADFVLKPEDMPERLIEYVRKYYGKRTARLRDAVKDPAGMANILALVRTRTKHDFTGYKQSTIYRRIERRMGINKIDNLRDYFKFLREHPAEAEALAKDFLINVTSFFRDPESFEGLKAHLKKLIENKPAGAEIRAWVPGCSTGEEAYSIVIIIEEALEELKKYNVVQVFGTDLDREAINAARAGVYPAAITDVVNEERLKKFFVKKDGFYQIKRAIREKLVFAEQDITGDPPFTRMDLISARNLLIYFDSDLQKRLIPLMHYALNPGGLLFLGTAETVGEFSRLFTQVERKYKIYKVADKDKRTPVVFRAAPVLHGAGETQNISGQINARPVPGARTAEQILLEALPASVLVDASFQVIYSHGNTRKYLGVPEGIPNTNLTEVVHPELRASLSAMLHEAVSRHHEVMREGGRVKLNGSTQAIRITVKPVAQPGPGEPSGRIIVTFQDLPEQKRPHRKGAAGDSRVADLEKELKYTKENLRSTIEQMETTNEELRSANEEYQSTNEELQSTNEELETSREELQSVNEELNTVNAEYQSKNEELSTANDDMKNLLNSIPVATIYLDNNLKVQRFTPAATNVFNFIATDIDRPISHITSKIGDIDITEKAEKVLDSLIPVQDVIQSKENKLYAMRIFPYRTSDNAIAGVVLTFMDISEHEKVKVALSYAEAIINTLFQPVIVLDSELKVVSANRAFYDFFKVSHKETENKVLYEVDDLSWNIPELRKLLEKILPRQTEILNYAVEAEFPHIGRRKLSLNARRLNEKDGPEQRILVVMDDITNKK